VAARHKIGEKHGWRNAQARVLAPTGTIGLMMDCDTTGVEPDLALVKFKKLVGGGSMQIVNQTVPRALRTCGYPEEQVEAIVEYIAEHGHVVDAPGLKPEHYAVFDCAMGERAIAPMGHVRMMAASSRSSPARSPRRSTCRSRRPSRTSRTIYYEGWKLRPQGAGDLPRQLQGRPAAVARSARRPPTARGGRAGRREGRRVPPGPQAAAEEAPVETVSFSVGDAEGYLTASSYPDDGSARSSSRCRSRARRWPA
jgi:ribonucleoside-diphosphate reductase alpha chain